ncbi:MULTISPECIES: hypothetical protein [Lactiplantibacillus]|uniref:hypothetical protein n=1 Tax=Lactiplantibacillus TaxID=2767842 RepID=UPI00062A6299|nr:MULTISPECIES: hypothetical protein [Lactiplantibacillus]KKX43707.1 hypothetical protein WH27_11630 [Lactiplantibacillus plantarum]MBQ0836543.1 hypothetical protein [Lactiplantibacillus pentosus]MBU7449069.1 hypothetical protein [Lactiplantibacillus sp. 7.2.4]MBU7481852.1 hypothetical protein [Lactiplantibacillus pentosus]
MFNKSEIKKYSSDGTNLVSIVKSLNYFETINFLAVINKANNPSWTNRKCYLDATNMYSDDDRMSFLIQQAFKNGLC